MNQEQQIERLRAVALEGIVADLEANDCVEWIPEVVAGHGVAATALEFGRRTLTTPLDVARYAFLIIDAAKLGTVTTHAAKHEVIDQLVASIEAIKVPNLDELVDELEAAGLLRTYAVLDPLARVWHEERTGTITALNDLVRSVPKPVALRRRHLDVEDSRP